jgi:hypothetical protein
MTYGPGWQIFHIKHVPCFDLTWCTVNQLLHLRAEVREGLDDQFFFRTSLPAWSKACKRRYQKTQIELLTFILAGFMIWVDGNESAHVHDVVVGARISDQATCWTFEFHEHPWLLDEFLNRLKRH